MRRIFIVVLSIIMAAVVMKCQATPHRPILKATLNDLKALNLGRVSKSDIRNKFGSPDEIENGKWTYWQGATPKLWFFFKNDKLRLVSWSIWEKDPASNLSELVTSVSGKWKVIKEPMTNPHSAPSLCYLEDLKGGKRVEVSGYKKTATEITFWQPSENQKSIKEYLYRNVGKEFCLASSCSKVTDPDDWKHNHCEWLEKLVAKKQGPVKKDH